MNKINVKNKIPIMYPTTSFNGEPLEIIFSNIVSAAILIKIEPIMQK